ncbi:MAG: hypothetical protein V3575_02705, partial [Candidatus Absconditabacteria bacterium]
MNQGNILTIDDKNFDDYFIKNDNEYLFKNNVDNNQIINFYIQKEDIEIKFSTELSITFRFNECKIKKARFEGCKLEGVHIGSPIKDSEIGSNIGFIKFDDCKIDNISFNYLNMKQNNSSNTNTKIIIKTTTFKILYFYKLYY